MRAWLVAGPAGAGKSTLGAALAADLGAVLLDLDTLTNPLLDGLTPLLPSGAHWNDDHLRHVVRPARYAALLATAAAQVSLGHDPVLVAPFTAELGGGEPWERARSALHPAEIQVVWLTADPAVLLSRVRARGESRDAGRSDVGGVQPPAIPHQKVDATLPTAAQVQVLTST